MATLREPRFEVIFRPQLRRYAFIILTVLVTTPPDDVLFFAVMQVRGSSRSMP